MNHASTFSLPKQPSNHLISLDFIRSIAIMAVVCVHTLPVPLININGGLALSAAVGALSKIGVPLFLMLTGYLMLDRDYSGTRLHRFIHHNYLPLMAAYELWVTITFIVRSLGQHSLDIKAFVGSVLFVGDPIMIHFWYMQMLLGVYLLIPMLAMFLRKIMDEGYMRYFNYVMALILAFVFLIPTILTVCSWFGYSSDAEVTLGGFAGRGALGVAYMLFGYWAKIYIAKCSNMRSAICWSGFLCALVLLVGLSMMELSYTKDLFLVTSGYLPIALMAIAFLS